MELKPGQIYMSATEDMIRNTEQRTNEEVLWTALQDL